MQVFVVFLFSVLYFFEILLICLKLTLIALLSSLSICLVILMFPSFPSRGVVHRDGQLKHHLGTI